MTPVSNPQVRNGVRLSGTFSTEAAGGTRRRGSILLQSRLRCQSDHILSRERQTCFDWNHNMCPRSYDIPVRWGQDTCLTISYSRNPQIRNSLRLSGRKTSLAGGTGLLMRNYRPKLFRLPNLHSESATPIDETWYQGSACRTILDHYCIYKK
jgi:hypothetical protein